MVGKIKFLQRFFTEELWNIDEKSLGRGSAFFIRTLRLIYMTIHEFSKGELNLRAMGLVYSTLLALVPLLALSFSVLKAFGVHNQLKDMLGTFLLPLGAKGIELTNQIIAFVDNIKIGVLSAIGLILLVYTIIALIHKIEQAVNHIWRIDRPRSLARRFSDYMSVVLAGPVLIFAALGIKALFMSHSFIQRLLLMEPLGTIFYAVGLVLPFVFICLSFTFIIIFIPNTRVKFGSALLGGLIAGISWQLMGWVFSSFVASSAKYEAIYSSFAVLFIFIIWLYLNWLIILIGAQVAFCHQNLDYITIKDDAFDLSNRLKEKICFAVMYLIAHNFFHDKEMLTTSSLATELSLPTAPVSRIITQLQASGILTETSGDPPTYIPNRSLDKITLKDIVDAVRVGDKRAKGFDKKFRCFEDVEEVDSRIEHSMEEMLGSETLRDLVLESKAELKKPEDQRNPWSAG